MGRLSVWGLSWMRGLSVRSLSWMGSLRMRGLWWMGSWMRRCRRLLGWMRCLAVWRLTLMRSLCMRSLGSLCSIRLWTLTGRSGRSRCTVRRWHWCVWGRGGGVPGSLAVADLETVPYYAMLDPDYEVTVLDCAQEQVLDS